MADNLDPIFVRQKLLELGASEKEIEQNTVYLLFNLEDEKYELIRDNNKFLIRNVN